MVGYLKETKVNILGYEITCRKIVPKIWTHWALARIKGKLKLYKNGKRDKDQQDMTLDFWLGTPKTSVDLLLEAKRKQAREREEEAKTDSYDKRCSGGL